MNNEVFQVNGEIEGTMMIIFKQKKKTMFDLLKPYQNKKKVKRKCSYCRTEGHNKKTCHKWKMKDVKIVM